MRSSILILSMIALVCSVIIAAPRTNAPQPDTQTPDESSSVRFMPFEVFIETGDQPLAAYQFEFVASDANARVVGIEGGDHPAFKKPPYYDPKAMKNERVIVAAFSLNAPDSLPSGRVRIATIHMMFTGDVPVKTTAKLKACGTVGGMPIQATIDVPADNN